MRRIICVFLLLCIVLSLCACSKGEAGKAASGLQVGFGRVSIHTDEKIELSCYFFERISNGFLDHIQATCVAITGGNGQTVLLYTVDVVGAKDTWTKELRTLVSQETGVPENNILFTGTHTHSGPEIRPADKYYKDIFKPAIIKAGVDAMADRAPATLQAASFDIEEMNFIRHYKMSDGTVAGDNFGNWDTAEAVENLSKADPEMQLVRAVRADKDDVLLVNWQAHPKLASSQSTNYGRTNTYNMTADYVAPLRDYVEKTAGDIKVAFYLGASGDVNPLDPHIKANQKDEHKTEKSYGNALGMEIVMKLNTMKAVEATDVVAESARQESNRKTGGTAMLPVDAVGVGKSIAFTTFPGEMFNSCGQYVKENSPYDITFVLTVAQEHSGYFPDHACFEYGGYEVTSTKFAEGAGEALSEKMVELLKNTYEAK